MTKAFEDYVKDFEQYLKPGWGLKPPVKPKPEERAAAAVEAVSVLDEAEKVLVKKVQGEIDKLKLAPVIVRFNPLLFHAAVLEKVEGKYGVKNPCTIAFQAADLGMVTPCASLEHAKGYWDYLCDLYEEGFADIFGYGYAGALEKVKEPGCPNCTGEFAKCGGWMSLRAKALYMGDKFYVILLYLEDTLQKNDDLNRLIAFGVSWKRVKYLLGPWDTLYHVGNLARYIQK